MILLIVWLRIIRQLADLRLCTQLNTSLASGEVQIGELDKLGVVTALVENRLDHSVDVALAPYAACAEADYLHCVTFLWVTLPARLDFQLTCRRHSPVCSQCSASAAAFFKLIIFQNDISAQLRNIFQKRHGPGGLLEAVVRFSIIVD